MVKPNVLDTLKLAHLGILKFTARMRTHKTERKPRREPFHAVVVRPGAKSCAAVSRLVGQRFLSDDAPQLPLPGCDQASCGCAYKHFVDRRQGPRRGEDDERSERGSSTDNRRNPGRRADA